MTEIINLLGGAGTGKSTTAAGLFYKMKLANILVEIVPEYIKGWAWERRNITSIDQLYITTKQMRFESILVDQTDWMICESPILLCPVYEAFYSKNKSEGLIERIVPRFMLKMFNNGCFYHNYMLKRTKPYVKAGRFQTEAEANEVDALIEEWMVEHDIAFKKVDVGDAQKVDFILDDLGIYTHVQKED